MSLMVTLYNESTMIYDTIEVLRIVDLVSVFKALQYQLDQAFIKSIKAVKRSAI